SPHPILPQGVRGQLGSAILKPNLRRIKQRIDHAEHGGGLLLGVDGICIISHGSSQAPSIFNAIRLAKDAIGHQVLQRIQSYYGKASEQASSSQQMSQG
ncbi:MAG: phosphate acyltransferase, partial [Kamptonema sp. SIO4C4]|nr:phosphate acyltransferase [Kamptonema sp. SIO4C4]